MQSLPAWTPRATSAACRSSSVALARAVLGVRDSLTTAHLREALKIAVWKFTECDGKYSTRYRSEASLGAPTQLVHHEHVIAIRVLVDRLIADPGLCENVLASAVGCVVLRSEHALLGEVEKAHPDVTGGDRYRLAGIKVWDLSARDRIV